MNDVKTPVAEPSAAAPEVTQEINLADLSPEDRKTWRDTGDIPAQPKKQDSAPADAPKVEKSDTPAESEAAPSQDKPKRKDKLNAEERIAQLVAEKKDLEERLRKRASEPTTESSPKAEPKAEPKAPPKRPKLPDPYKAESPEKYQEAIDEYDKQMEAYEKAMREQAVAEDRQRQAAEAEMRKMSAQIDSVQEKYGEDAKQKLISTANAIFNDAEIVPVVKAMLNEGTAPEILPHLLYVLSDAATLANFTEAARKNPAKAMRTIVEITQSVEKELGKSAPETEKPSAAKSEPDPEPKAPSGKPPVPLVTRATRPPEEVGGRGTAPEDEAESAVRSGDFRSAKGAWNRQALASKR